MKERLQKVLANQGYGSRREIEGWIAQGRIKVNGEVAELGCQIDGTESITIDNRRVELPETEPERRVLLYYKPEGEITTRHDPEGRPTVFESLPHINNGRWIAVGRLDINTQGLLLVTNDGELAHRLMHPSHELEREYAVRVIGDFTDEMADNMRNGVEFDDGISKFEEILWSGGSGANFWYHVTVKGGKNREVRRLWESQGLMVSRLIRIRYGNVELPLGLKAGQFIDIEPEVLKELVESVGLTHEEVKTTEEQERLRAKPRRVGRNQKRRRREDSIKNYQREHDGRTPQRDRRAREEAREEGRGRRNNRNRARTQSQSRGERRGDNRNERFERSERDERPNRRENRSERGNRPSSRPSRHSQTHRNDRNDRGRR